MKSKSREMQMKVFVRAAGFGPSLNYRPGVKTISVASMAGSPRSDHSEGPIGSPRPATPRTATRSAVEPARDVPPRGRKAFHNNELSNLPQQDLDARTGRRVAPVRSESPLPEWYRTLEAERAKRVSETARVVSGLLAEGLRQADKVMTLAQLSFLMAAISVEVISGRNKPNLQDRIERILTEVCHDELNDGELDEYDGEDL